MHTVTMARWRVISFTLSFYSVLGQRLETEAHLGDLMSWCAHATIRTFPVA